MTPISKKRKSIVPAARKITPRVVKPIEVKPTKPLPPPNPSFKLYRQIAGGFIGAVLLLLLIVLALSTTKAVIRVTPLIRTVETSFLTDVVKDSVGEGEVLGNIVEQTFEQAQTFAVSGTETREVLEKSSGTVTIINDSSRNQPLVATTRLLSTGGVLFRLDNSVMVPAGGSTTAKVHADQVGPTGDIGPDKFIIPGLATSLQSQIYAESSVVMTGGRKLVSVVTEGTLNALAEQLSAEISAAGQEQLRTIGKGSFDGEAFLVETISKTSDTQPGEEKDSVTISMKRRITGVFFDGNALEKLAKAKLYENLTDGFVLVSPDGELDDLTVEVSGTRSDLVQASLSVTAATASVVSNTSPFLQPEVLVGKNASEVETYLVSAGLAEGVTVWFFPPWLRRVPNMVDHVTVEVKE
jgi:hypothetical protein